MTNAECHRGMEVFHHLNVIAQARGFSTKDHEALVKRGLYHTMRYEICRFFYCQHYISRTLIVDLPHDVHKHSHHQSNKLLISSMLRRKVIRYQIFPLRQQAPKLRWIPLVFGLIFLCWGVLGLLILCSLDYSTNSERAMVLGFSIPFIILLCFGLAITYLAWAVERLKRSETPAADLQRSVPLTIMPENAVAQDPRGGMHDHGAADAEQRIREHV